MKLRKFALSLASAAMLIGVSNAVATEMPPLAKKYNCTNCHAIDVTMIGPSWMEVSKAYTENGKTSIGTPISYILGSKTPAVRLKYKISHGGAGTWGTVAMPANDPSDTFQESIDVMVNGILGLSKGAAPKEDFLQLTKKYNCTACHAMDRKLIGPSWMDISKFYNDDGTTPYGVKASEVLRSKTPEEMLSYRISHGGLGQWGVKYMPAMEYVDLDSGTKPGSNQRHDDIEELVKFIINLAKK